MTDGLAGKVAVVTGTAHGIGTAIAAALRGDGATVHGVDKDQADLTDSAAVRAFFAAVGPVDILVNNAGVALVDRLVDQDGDAIRQSFALNVLAPLELTRQVLPGMLARGRGRIVNISSLAGITAFPTLSTYGATKAALVHFSAALQRELRRTPVRVTIVQLGEVAGTEMMEAARTSPTIAAVSRRLASVHALPTLTTRAVAVAVVDAAATGRRHCVVPRRVVGLHLIRELPSRLNDAVLYRID
jgi:short-subunit dehydrogenase